MEGAMPRVNLPSKNVPRVEYDYRAREARLQLEQLERLLVRRHAVKTLRLFRRFRLLAFNASGAARRGDRSKGSPSDRRPCGMSMPPLASSTTAPAMVSCRNLAYARQNSPIGARSSHRKAPRALFAMRQHRDIAEANTPQENR